MKVNLRHVQVKAVSKYGKCSGSDSQEQSITESDDDIDLVVHEISKPFGHFGTRSIVMKHQHSRFSLKVKLERAME